MRHPETAEEWDGYLGWFHQERAGITEHVLSASLDRHGETPYDWIAGQLPAEGLIVDMACGSAPLWHDRLSGRYLGVDVSGAELELARKRGAHDLVCASATALPVADGAAAAVVCSMALMILPDLPGALAEARRVLHPTGVFVAIVPTGPTRLNELTASAGLLRAAGGHLGYRNDPQLRHPGPLFAENGLRIVEHSRQTYRFELTRTGNPEKLAASLYLRGARDREQHVARFLQRAAARGHNMPVPIRRFLARPTGIGP